MITQDKLKDMFHYEPDTGELTRIVGRNRRRGQIPADEYRRTTIDGKTYPLHRLAFLYMDGSMPEDEVDHINGDRQDNRWSNLRAVSKSENQRNVSRRSDNTSGVTGVNWSKSKNKWESSIFVEGTRVYLGSFVEFSEAVNARKLAEVAYGYHENHGR